MILLKIFILYLLTFILFLSQVQASIYFDLWLFFLHVKCIVLFAPFFSVYILYWSVLKCINLSTPSLYPSNELILRTLNFRMFILFFFLNFISLKFSTFKLISPYSLYFLIMKVKWNEVKIQVTQSCPILTTPWNIQSTELTRQNSGVGSLSLLQGIFPAQRSNQGALHCRRVLYQLSHKGSPRILEWAAYPFSSRSSQHRNRTRVWATFLSRGIL